MTPIKPPPTRPAPPPSRAAAAPPAHRFLTVAAAQPVIPRIVYYAVEGFGKTSLPAFAPNPVILQARDEVGYQTLLNAGRVPAIPAPVVNSWPECLGWLDSLIADRQGRDVLALDALGGFERLCHEFVCHRDFQDEWGEHGFASFQKGYDVSVAEWLKMLQRLDQLQAQGVTVVLLGHARIRPFKNPLGADFDRYECDVHQKTWAVTARGSDCVLFGNFFSVVDVSKRAKGNSTDKKGKGIGGADRVVYTERRDAFDAKNRYGMEKELWLPADPSQVWGVLWNEITRTKQEQQS